MASLPTRGLLLALLFVLGTAVPAAFAQDPPPDTTSATTESGTTTNDASTTGETPTTTTTTTTTGETTAMPVVDEDALRERIARYRAKARYLRRVIGAERPRVYLQSTSFATSTDYLIALKLAWQRKAVAARLRYRNPPHLAAWRCIHRYEGPWKDPNAPYYGGLQMDVTFQRMYGRYLLRRKGTANRWRPREQMWVAERALRAGRGFHPWPVTARRCGLL